MHTSFNFLISDLLAGYHAQRFSPTEVIESALQRADESPERHVWISRLSHNQVMEYVRAIEQRPLRELPLYGIPFVVKDNIDLAGVPTTAACRAFSYVPSQSAAVVQRMLDAGAIPLGKTNLDQFATGLVGTRSPYGECRNSFNEDYISGGSSSGSAVAVATGLASFGLGTDTAGSGRVPAAFNNIVGLKPSCGRISTRGVVPACRSLDCVSIFALTSEDALRVLSIAEGYDEQDPYSRRLGDQPLGTLRVGIPRRSQLQFFGDHEYGRLYEEALARIPSSIGAILSELDFEPFLAAGRLLYNGPWVAERYAAIDSFMQSHADAVHPVTREIIEGGRLPTAVELFKAQYELQSLRRAVEQLWNQVDVILTPTAGTIYGRANLRKDPIRLNATLGYYTNYMNLLDMTGVAIPAGFRPDGLPFGVTLAGPAGTERALLKHADKIHRALVVKLGALDVSQPLASPLGAVEASGYIEMAVCGAHMRGLALNHQLVQIGGLFVRSSRTAPHYKLYALPGQTPQRPALVRINGTGASIDLEVWAVPAADFGSFVAGIPEPLGIGRIELEDGIKVSGFLCESWATEHALDITAFGGWHGYLGRAK
jgi:allophanate hydrolase